MVERRSNRFLGRGCQRSIRTRYENALTSWLRNQKSRLEFWSLRLREVAAAGTTPARGDEMWRLLKGCLAVLVVVSLTQKSNADVVTIDGTVKSVEAKKRTITVESGSKTLTLDVSSKAKISVEGKDGSLDLLKPGQTVKVSYHDK